MPAPQEEPESALPCKSMPLPASSPRVMVRPCSVALAPAATCSTRPLSWPSSVTPGPVMLMFWVISSGLFSETWVTRALKVITSPGTALASVWRRLPRPLSLPLATMRVAACSGPARASAASRARAVRE